MWNKLIQTKTSRSLVLSALSLGAVLLIPPPVHAEEFCAVTLNVFGPHGEPNSSTWIELDDTTGNAVRRELMTGPTLYLCDFGFGPHTLRVGTNECLPVAISNLRAVFGSPITLNVTLNACGYNEKVRSGCLLYVRVVDDEGHPIPDVEFSPPGRANEAPKTDSYGRYQVLFSGMKHVTLSKHGFAPEAVSVLCQAKEEIDRQVVMKKELNK